MEEAASPYVLGAVRPDAHVIATVRVVGGNAHGPSRAVTRLVTDDQPSAASGSGAGPPRHTDVSDGLPPANVHGGWEGARGRDPGGSLETWRPTRRRADGPGLSVRDLGCRDPTQTVTEWGEGGSGAGLQPSRRWSVCLTSLCKYRRQTRFSLKYFKLSK